MIRNKLKSLVLESVKKSQENKEILEFEMPDITIEQPEVVNFGDYSSNIALQISKFAKMSPTDVANIIIKNIKKEKYIKNIKVVKPGFINFYLSDKYFQGEVLNIIDKRGNFGKCDIGKGRKIHLDFVSANPTGPVHLGNGRGGPFGDVLANILENAGYKTWREYIVNDYGNQIKILGHSILKDDKAQYKGEYIDKLNKEIKGEDPFEVGQEAAKKIIKEIITPSMESLGIYFDKYYSEKSLHESGKVEEVLNILREKGLIYEKEDALWFKSKKYGDEKDRVVRKSTGEITYFGGDIAYHLSKFERGCDIAIDIWGADHHGDVKRVMGAMEALGYKGRLKIILTQFVQVIKDGKEYKMSKRKGTYITIDDLVSEVGKDAVRFFFLMYSADKHMKFDIDLAREKSNKNPVYYVQYAHVRICNIFKKSGIEESTILKNNANLSLLSSKVEINLIRELNMLPEIVSDVAISHEVHRLPFYAKSLADKFHIFYENCRVLDEKTELKNARLKLLKATQIVLKNTLNILGVDAPERM